MICRRAGGDGRKIGTMPPSLRAIGGTKKGAHGKSQRKAVVILALTPPESQSTCSEILRGPNYFLPTQRFGGAFAPSTPMPPKLCVQFRW
jgi:hypothetical protein